jgi:hypothetical protein
MPSGANRTAGAARSTTGSRAPVAGSTRWNRRLAAPRGGHRQAAEGGKLRCRPGVISRAACVCSPPRRLHRDAPRRLGPRVDATAVSAALGSREPVARPARIRSRRSGANSGRDGSLIASRRVRARRSTVCISGNRLAPPELATDPHASRTVAESDLLWTSAPFPSAPVELPCFNTGKD